MENNIFPKDFLFIDFYHFIDNDTEETIIAVVFKELKEANNWKHLLLNEPFSFTFEKGATDNSKFVFRFTNFHSDYSFPVPKRVEQKSLNFLNPYQIAVCVLGQDMTLQKIGDSVKMIPQNLN